MSVKSYTVFGHNFLDLPQVSACPCFFLCLVHINHRGTLPITLEIPSALRVHVYVCVYVVSSVACTL